MEQGDEGEGIKDMRKSGSGAPTVGLSKEEIA